MVEAKGVSKAFGERVLLKDFSTRILRGDRVAMVGPNGAGKTTLVKLLLGEIPADAGEVKLGTNLEIAYIDQARAALTPETTLREVLAAQGRRPDHGARRAEARRRLRQGLPVHATASCASRSRSLSGGERNRLLLARALANPANVLVLDEPTNDLDMDTLDLLEDLLADYEGTLILVSHDRDFIDRLATSTIGLDGTGRAVETPGGWQDFIAQNPGFFARLPVAAFAAPKALPPPPPEARRPARAKLTYKDQRRLRGAGGPDRRRAGADRRPGSEPRRSWPLRPRSGRLPAAQSGARSRPRTSSPPRRRNGWSWRSAARPWRPAADWPSLSCG